jgi:hypothetical protein
VQGLTAASRDDLAWVITTDRTTVQALETQGFAMRQAWRGGVMLWERPQAQVRPAPRVDQAPFTARLAFWGGPLGAAILVALAVALMARRRWARHAEATG